MSEFESLGLRGGIWQGIVQRATPPGRLLLVHEGGYSEAYVPFCGHAAIAALAGSSIEAVDPVADTLATRQPDARWVGHVSAHLRDLAAYFEV